MTADWDKEIRKKGNKIPLAVIKRLPIYHRYLTMLADSGLERISSKGLADRIGITASQLRQDLSWFGRFGQQGYGYRVSELLEAISRILGIHQIAHMVLVGAGNLGHAIASYASFKRRGFLIDAIFDNNPNVIGTEINNVPVKDIKDLSTYLAENAIEIGIITTPVYAAQDIADVLCEGGVKAIWNFAPINLKVPSHVVTEDVHIGESLLALSFKIQHNGKCV